MFFDSIKVVERACKVDIEMKGQLTVKQMISLRDISNFLQGIEKSNLKKGNNVVVRWLQSSNNLKKKIKIVFHDAKFILT